MRDVLIYLIRLRRCLCVDTCNVCMFRVTEHDNRKKIFEKLLINDHNYLFDFRVTDKCVLFISHGKQL